MVLPFLGKQGNKRKLDSQQSICILQTYAQTAGELEKFLSAGHSRYLSFAELLTAFPSGSVPRQPFTCGSQLWQLECKSVSDRTVHLAVPASNNSSKLDQHQQYGLNSCKQAKEKLMSTSQHHAGSNVQLLEDVSDRDLDGEQRALQRYSSANSFSNGHPYPSTNGSNSFNRHCESSDYSSGFPSPNNQPGNQFHQQQQQHFDRCGSGSGSGSGPGAADSEMRKFNRNLLHANNTRKEALERYKAIMSCIESCKRKVAAHAVQVASTGDSSCWGGEQGSAIVQAVLDVGEALASFGNHQFPEHSNEGRAILAGDYKALLRQYLSNFGWLFAQTAKQQLPVDLQEEVQSVGSLLATRCEAYDLLYDQLVRHVGLEGRGGPSTLVLNHNSAAANPTTSITANPTNTTTASANSKSKVVQKGLGGAAIAAAALAALLLVRTVKGSRGRHSRSSRGSGGGGGGGSGGSSSSLVQQQRQLRIPKGKNGRELLLVTQLSACGDEIRRARGNEELLKDDWRLGRHVRLAWPPGPPLPPGYQEPGPDACNVSQLLQEMYG